MKLSKLTEALVNSLFSNRSKLLSTAATGDRITISRTISALAFIYERIRAMIEYREEHLLRRAAIERILKRRLILNENGRDIAESLLKELLWAKYLPENSIFVSKIDDIQASIDKFIFLRNEISRGRGGSEVALIHEWSISSLAAEVEEKLVAYFERESFINFVFHYFKEKVFLKDEDNQTRDIQVYIAVHRAFAKSDNDYIRYNLLKLVFPNFQKMSWKEMQHHTASFYQTLLHIEKQLNHRLGSRLSKILKKEMPPFLILRDLYKKSSNDFKATIENEAKLENEVDSLCRRRYEEIGKKLRTAGTRSIIYIFLTKMLFAFLLEYPFDKYVMKSFDLTALAINTLTPPFLMFLLVVGISAPGEDNTRKIIQKIKHIIGAENESVHTITLTLKTPNRRPILRFIFSVIYLSAFIITFGGISLILTALHFSIASQAIFLFFMCVVLFFGYRIRQTGQDYIVSEQEGIFTPVIDFFMLPVLNMGKWLSSEISKLNFFVALFDFVIEAPFKAIVEIFEEWFSFMRRKKEEII